MERDAHSNELGRFLRARRAELTPDMVGFSKGAEHRRVPGLRREEVAELASISVQYYTRVEQGRLRVSAPVLDTLAEVLRLDGDQLNYLHELVGADAPRPRRGPAKQKVRASTLRLLDVISAPAIILGRRMDILAWNPLAAALLGDFSQLTDSERNYACLVFSDSELRRRYENWEDLAPDCVAFLRMEAARDPQDPELESLVAQLSAMDSYFRTWWGEHNVAVQTAGVKTIRHPVVGAIQLDWETLTCSTDGDQHLVVWTAEPGTLSAERLALLASEAARLPNRLRAGI
ncbi:helix-turn-helix domain-containing protein [Streptomyces sp. Tu 4128]|uniref:helix-turn-helix domain-containing protein n=1 Tax=Streptomyces sp. Tu 4128 TaxID=1120314 RepID=UPI000F02404B|nr:helix-turn-helix domain-containing protein [Streptomyces sp. Tu 4128]